MMTGPQNMPKFSDRQLSPEEKKDIVAYVRMATEAPDPGGYGLGGFGPSFRGHGDVDYRHRRGHRRGAVDRSPSMSDDLKGTDTPTDAELASMSREQLVELGGRIDGVETVFKEDRWPVPGTRAEKRSRARGGVWPSAGRSFGSGAAADLLVLAVGVQGRAKPRDHFWYDLATPLYGLTFGLSILGDRHRRGAVPEEVHPRRDLDPGAPRRGLPRAPRKTVAANLTDALEGSTLKRRKLIGLSLGIGLGAFGLGTLVAFMGGLIKNPWKPVVPTAEGDKAVLWTSGWTPRFKGETVYLARATGRPGESPFVKMRPEDIDAGGMETVFPWRASDGDGHDRRVAREAQRDRDGCAQPGDVDPHQTGGHGQGGQAQGPGELQLRRAVRLHQGVLAFGLPSSLYEQQSYRIPPAPANQSQFDALHFARPIFGPAARALAQLPLTIDQDGYLVANGDFIEPVGPAFWERRS